MKFGYTQLTAEERYHIYTMLGQEVSLRQIAKGMGRSHTSLSREIRRNKGDRGYRHKQAHRKAQARHKTKPKALKMTGELTTTAITALLASLKGFVHTITYDNGREFSDHKAVSSQLDCKAFFARPYHSWERGLNENSNGLLRQYFPKSMPLDSVSEEEVFAAANAMNHRPRKCLGYKTPWEVFTELTHINAFLISTIRKPNFWVCNP